MLITGNRKTISWLWQTWKGYRFQALLNAFIGVMLVVADLSFVWATKLTIDIATHVETDVKLSTAIFLLGGIILLQLSLGVASRWVRALLGVKAQNHMRRVLFERLLGSNWKDLKRFHTGNLINRIEQDVSTVITFLTENIPTLFSTLLQFLGAFLFLFWMDAKLTCIVVLIIPFFLICSKLYVKKMRRITHDIRDEESRVQSVIQETLQHALVVKALERTSTAVSRLGGLQRLLHSKVLNKTKYSTISSTVLNAGFALGYMVTFVWGVSSLEQGLITYGALIAFIQLVGQIQHPVRILSRFIPIFINAFTATDRLRELEKIPMETVPEGAGRELHGKVGVRLDNVTFFYKDNDGHSGRKIFEDFSFDFSPGGITAIVGETGAGKTTLIRLLLALMSPVEGRVGVYDENGNTAAITPATRRYFSYVPQGNTLLSGTIRENLQLGNPNASEEEMITALRLAAADFVFKLTDGLDARCGEMGDGLSEGQAQRIAIARALLRRSPVLLLDEATSSLDGETEKRVLKSIVDNLSGTTVIVITHRPEVLKYATQELDLKRHK